MHVPGSEDQGELVDLSSQLVRLRDRLNGLLMDGGGGL